MPVELRLGELVVALEVIEGELRDMIRGLLDSIEGVCGEALRHAQLGWSSLDDVLLAGGSSKLPSVRELLEGLAQRAPRTDFDPMNLVAQGAAWYADLIQSGRITSDELLPGDGEGPTGSKGGKVGGLALPIITSKTARGLGVLAWDEGRKRDVVVWLIRAGAELPRDECQQFVTQFDAQTSIRVRFYEGSPRQVEDGVDDPQALNSVGECVLEGIPPEPRGTPIDVGLSAGLGGAWKARVKHSRTGQVTEGRFDLDPAHGPSDAREPDPDGPTYPSDDQRRDELRAMLRLK
jgi:molecular chaperone DnaK